MANTKPSAARFTNSDGENDGSPKNLVTIAKEAAAEIKETTNDAIAHCPADALPMVNSIPAANRQREMFPSKVSSALYFILSNVWKTCPAQLLSCPNKQSAMATGNNNGTLSAPTNQRPVSVMAAESSRPNKNTDIKILPQ